MRPITPSTELHQGCSLGPLSFRECIEDLAAAAREQWARDGRALPMDESVLMIVAWADAIYLFAMLRRLAYTTVGPMLGAAVQRREVPRKTPGVDLPNFDRMANLGPGDHMDGRHDLEFRLCVQQAWRGFHAKRFLRLVRGRWQKQLQALRLVVFSTDGWSVGARHWTSTELRHVRSMQLRMTRGPTRAKIGRRTRDVPLAMISFGARHVYPLGTRPWPRYAMQWRSARWRNAGGSPAVRSETTPWPPISRESPFGRPPAKAPCKIKSTKRAAQESNGTSSHKTVPNGSHRSQTSLPVCCAEYQGHGSMERGGPCTVMTSVRINVNLSLRIRLHAHKTSELEATKTRKGTDSEDCDDDDDSASASGELATQLAASRWPDISLPRILVLPGWSVVGRVLGCSRLGPSSIWSSP